MFDPFKDFEQAGYLRNVDRLKELEEVKLQEHAFFIANVEVALSRLRRVRGPIVYRHFLQTHRLLFEGFYPWAGLDRHALGVGRLVGKGDRVHFELAELCQAAVDHGLRMGNNPRTMRKQPGAVMGAFAWGHPFLDGNGRTMLLIHTELCRRAGFAIDWNASDKGSYLDALTRELADPRGAHLDAYLAPLMVDIDGRADFVGRLKRLPGLDGLDSVEANVDYAADDVSALQSYADLKRGRGEALL
ncbi:Fic family protein [Roseateles sp. MS654]|uniref:Fic family protein n=1 Tax=Roseateles sp. MS654 TaxID=3412685 RepID=UPI003C3019A7